MPTLKNSITLLFAFTIYLQGFTSITLASELNKTENSSPIKTDVVDLYNATEQRPVKIDLWYTENTCTDKECQKTSENTLNIAILSHGAMGSSKDYSWLAYPLAAQGWIVIGVNHFGESWRYGSENIDPTSVTRFWQRTEDVSFTLDSLESILPAKLVSTKTNIVVVGHSSGGYTAAALAGITLDGKQMYNYCASKHAKEDLGCSYGKSESPKQLESLTYKAKYGLDSRVAGIIMLDPAMGPASTKNSMNNVKLPTLIIGSENNDFLPFEYHAKYYADNIPNAKLIALRDGEGHFVYINSCENNYKARGVSLCQDRKGVNRGEVHQKLLGHIIAFLSNDKLFN